MLDGATNPLLADTSGIGNYQLQSTSPCIDAGRNDSIPAGILTDFAGNARIYGAAADLGAYEYGIFAPNVNLGNDTSFCSNVVLTLNAQNPGASYLWNTGATTQTIPVTTGGMYYVSVTNTIGTARDTIVITVNPQPVVSLGNDTAICMGTTLTLNAQNTGAAYLWNNGSTAQTRSAGVAGTYFVTVTSANQCKGSDTVVITTSPLPVVNLGADTAICDGSTLTLDAQNTGASYLWNDNTTGQTLTLASAGSYYVVVTNSNFCKKADTVQVSLRPLPVVQLGNDTAICAGSFLALDAVNASAAYLWSTGSTMQTIAVSVPGIYNVLVTDAYGCKGGDTIEIINNPLPVVDLGNDTAFCTGNTIVLDAQHTGAAYLWSNAQTSQTISVGVSGSYAVAVTNADQCTGTDTIQVIVNPLPLVSLGNDVTDYDGTPLTLDAGNAGAAYLWSTGATSQTITVTAAGTYSVSVTNSNGCSNADTIVLIAATVGIQEASQGAATLSVVPNPAREIVYIGTSDPHLLHTKAMLLDAYGRVVRELTINSAWQQLSLGGLASGIYLLKAQYGPALKIVKE